jgi:uncharacterized protein involved in outer membrane biogenesis
MKQLIKYVVIVLGVIVVILLAAPLLFKKQILTVVKKEVNRDLNASVSFDNDISLSFFRHFPDASVGISHFTVTGKGEYRGDTLASVPDARIVIDLASLFGGGAYRIRNVVLDHPYVQLLVDSAGNANWDITTPDTGSRSGSPSTFKTSLQKYSIHDGHVVFSDSANGFYLDAAGLDHTGKGDFTRSVFDLTTSSRVKSLTVAYGGIPYLDGLQTDLDAVLHIDMDRSAYTFEHTTLTLNGLSLEVDGSVSTADSAATEMDVSFKTSGGSFRSFLSLIPAIYQKDFSKLKASGGLSLGGHIRGAYSEQRIPAFDLQLQVTDGMFKYPSVPEPLSEVNLDLVAQNADGNPAHTVIDLRRLHLKMGANPLDGRLLVKNLKADPFIDGAVKGTLNLAEVSKIYPLEKGTSMGGMLQLDVQAKGPLRSLEKGKAGGFTAAGRLLAKDVAYRSASFDQGLSVPRAAISFSPQAAKIEQVAVRVGRSDLEASGRLDNLFGYIFRQAPLQGKLDVRSRLLDLNSIMGANTAGADTTSAVKAVQIPRDLDLSLQAAIDSFVYSTYVLTGLRGAALVSGGVLQLQDVHAAMLGGSVVLSGTYDTRQVRAPKTDLSLSVDSVDIPAAFRTFATVRAFAPAAAFARGRLSGHLSLNTVLDDRLNPRWRSLDSHGELRTAGLTVAGFAPLKKMASVLSLAGLENLHIPQLNLSYTIDSGFFRVKPFSFTAEGIRMDVSGKNGLDKKIDYRIGMRVPRSRLGAAGGALNKLAAQAAGMAGVSAQLPEEVDVGVLLRGAVSDPVVTLDLSREKAKLDSTLKAAAAGKLSREKAKLLDQLLGKDSGRKPNAPARTVEKALKKGLQGLLKQPKDTGR